MSNEEKILSILENMQSDIGNIKSDIEILKENDEEFRSNINTILEWTDEVGGLLQVDLIKRD
ncbi:MAG: hypothetical protein LBC82_07760 [Oscillospiraceae bacterium]|jgi:hypothetical protein|nr:hypothetical protein [Oscillospiraceae bacterium]